MSDLRYSFGSVAGAINKLSDAIEMLFLLDYSEQAVVFSQASIDQVKLAIANARADTTYIISDPKLQEDGSFKVTVSAPNSHPLQDSFDNAVAIARGSQ